jgi:hypothetical protein
MTVELNRQEYIAKQHRDVRHATYRRFMAEGRIAVKQQKEILALRRAILSPEPDPELALHRQAEDSLAVARAARETLLAKQNLAHERRNEAEMQMQVSHDEEEDLDGRIRVAFRQVGALIREMNMQGIYSTSLADLDEDEELVLFSNQHGQSTWPAPTPKSATRMRGGSVDVDGDDNTTSYFEVEPGLCDEIER